MGERGLWEPSAGNPHAGFCRGDEYKWPCRLGEGTDAKASATARLRKGYRRKARPYLPSS